MAIFKCKMCGGQLEIVAEESVVTCEYCGTKQTVPAADDEKKVALFGRANRLRLASEFDKAAGVYESIVVDFPEEAEGYWGLVLCKYGIEYVDDPATGKKIPTCHRSSFDSVMDDANFEQTLENADELARRVYREEAKAIEEIRKGIVSVSAKEEPYDIFICYKETDSKGERTVDSVMAQDVYEALTDKGYRVFFARISLEDKLGQEYEPYIFAALNSAKVMLAFGTDYEYFNAVWVKNEWARFLELMAKDKSKHLIPCYKGIDAYDMPKEFAPLQAQDLGKVGATQDLLRGIEKLLPKKKAEKETVVMQSANALIMPLLKRAFMALEDGDWKKSDDLFEQVLNLDPECGEAYLGELMVELEVSTREELKNCAEPFDGSNSYQKAVRFGGEKLKTELAGYVEHINVRNENARLEGVYFHAKNIMSAARSEEDFKKAAELFESIREYQDSASLIVECHKEAEEARRDAIYKSACEVLDDNHTCASEESGIKAHEEAIAQFQLLNGWKDSDEKILLCQKRIEEIKFQLEQSRLEAEYQKAIDLKNRNKFLPLEKAIETLEKAIEIFIKIEPYKDTENQILVCRELLELLRRIEPIQKYILKQEGKFGQLLRDQRYESLSTANLGIRLPFANSNRNEYDIQALKGAYSDSLVRFGVYNDAPIEWLPLSVSDSEALLISHTCIHPPHFQKSDLIDFEKSKLRIWLNNVFYKSCFGDYEKRMFKKIRREIESSLKSMEVSVCEDNVSLLTKIEFWKYGFQLSALRHFSNEKLKWLLLPSKSESLYINHSFQVDRIMPYTQGDDFYVRPIILLSLNQQLR